jgi:hypothetical protein
VPLWEVRSRLLGKPGTKVQILVVREGKPRHRTVSSCGTVSNRLSTFSCYCFNVIVLDNLPTSAAHSSRFVRYRRKLGGITAPAWKSVITVLYCGCHSVQCSSSYTASIPDEG